MIAGRWISTSGPYLETSNSSEPATIRSSPNPSTSTRQVNEGSDSRPSISVTAHRVDTAEPLLDKEGHTKDSHTARLKQILDEPALRSLFREFLRTNFCEENLSFWLDVQDFKRRFNTTSSAAASPAAVAASKGQKAQGHAAMEKHQGDLIAMAFVIYNSTSPLYPQIRTSCSYTRSS